MDMNLCGPEACLYESNIPEDTRYPFYIESNLRNFLESPINPDDDEAVSEHMKRIGTLAECAKQAKYLCRQMIDEVDNEIDMIEDGVHPEVNKVKLEANKKLRRKVKIEKKSYDEKVTQYELEHKNEVEKLNSELESRKQTLLTEMLTALEKQKEAIEARLKSGHSGGQFPDNLMASTGNNDNCGQVLTRKLRKKANAEAAACHISPEIVSGLNDISVPHVVSTIAKTHVQLDESMHEAALMTSLANGLLEQEKEEDPTAKYEEFARLKGPGNSIQLTENGFRVDSLLAELDVKLTDDEILNDLMAATKGKYKSTSQNSAIAHLITATSSSAKGSQSLPESKVTVNSHQSENSSSSGGQKSSNVYLEDKNLIYNNTTFFKGQQVYIEGNTKGLCNILGIKQQEVQLKKLNDSTKIKISLDMLRRGTYRLIER